jgi:transposase
VHGVRTEAVPFARPGAGFTRDFEDLVAWLATKMDKTAICRLARIDWDTVGRICQRVAAGGLDETRFDGLVGIGVDEVSWKRNHHYLTLVCDHAAKKVIWGAAGKDADTLDAFFAELGVQRAGALQAVSSDMSAAFINSITAGAPQATWCIDPFHAVKVVTDALDTVRRAAWQQMRATDPAAARKFKGARWALLKRPDHLTDDQAAGCAAAAATCDAPTACGRRSGPSSPATSTSTRSPNSSTGGSARHPAPAWRRSSRPPRPSASTAMASWPRST